MSRSPSPSRRKLTSTPRPDDTVVNHKKPFLVRHKDNSLLENRDFSSFARPKPRRTRSKSPTRRPRSTSPSRLGTSSVLPLPGIYCLCTALPLSIIKQHWQYHYRNLRKTEQWNILIPLSHEECNGKYFTFSIYYLFCCFLHLTMVPTWQQNCCFIFPLIFIVICISKFNHNSHCIWQL